MDGFTLRQLYTAAAALFRLSSYGLVAFAIWKLYQVLCQLNGNLAGIRTVLERTERNRFGGGS